MIKGCAGVAVLMVLATTAYANFAPVTSPVPKLRNTTVNLSGATVKRSPIPRLRDSKSMAAIKERNQEIATLLQIAELERQEESFRKAAEQAVQVKSQSSRINAITASAIPRLRPKSLTRRNNTQQASVNTTKPAKPVNMQKTKRYRKKGSVCGVRSIQGTNVSRIMGKGGCGIANPVKITEVAGISLTRELTVNCTTAKRFESWVSNQQSP